MTRYYPTITPSYTIEIKECRLMHEANGRCYIATKREGGMRLHRGKLFESRDGAVVHGIFLLRQVMAKAELGIAAGLADRLTN